MCRNPVPSFILENMARKNILVVDDEKGQREILEMILSEEGYDVTTAASGEAAIKFAKERRFDLALTDLKMTGMDGIEEMTVGSQEGECVSAPPRERISGLFHDVYSSHLEGGLVGPGVGGGRNVFNCRDPSRCDDDFVAVGNLQFKHIIPRR